MTRTIFTLLLLCSLNLYSQPGGGGGLLIEKIYNNENQEINILNDKNLKIRTFILKDKYVTEETFIHEKILKDLEKYPNYKYNSEFYLRPNNEEYSNQRLYITYAKDTMIVDFEGIIGQNGIGNIDEIDSLKIEKGYFKKIKNESYKNNHKYYQKIDISFLEEKNLPASFFLKTARYNLSNKLIEDAFTNINKAIDKVNGDLTCETLFLLTDAYKENKQYEKAIETISKAIANTCVRYNSDEPENIYEERVQLYIKINQFNKALKDYDTIVSVAYFKNNAIVNKANFEIKYLKNYKVVINNLKIIFKNQKKDYSDDLYFTLGLAEYLNGNKQDAYNHWIQSQEFLYSWKESDYYAKYFDSLIQKNPNEPKLYLAKALAELTQAKKYGKNIEGKKYSEKALTSINKAQQFKNYGFKINLYKAVALNYLNRDQEALKEINIAIHKNIFFPLSYLYRYNIRKGLTQVNTDYENDFDIIKYNELSKFK